jgi:hypothetical protein
MYNLEHSFRPQVYTGKTSPTMELTAQSTCWAQVPSPLTALLRQVR